MPIYDYECTSCGLKKEVMRKISESNLTLCPACNQETFAKQVSAPSFQLSGTGWYATDFKNNGKDNNKKTQASTADAKTADAKTIEPSTSTTTACATGCACH